MSKFGFDYKEDFTIFDLHEMIVKIDVYLQDLSMYITNLEKKVDELEKKRRAK